MVGPPKRRFSSGAKIKTPAQKTGCTVLKNRRAIVPLRRSVPKNRTEKPKKLPSPRTKNRTYLHLAIGRGIEAMFEWFKTAAAELTQSDLGPAPSPLWHIIATGQMAHILIGTMLALFRAPARLVGAVFVGWAVKEGLGDIPNAGGAWPVIADSVADLCFGALGYIIAKYQMENHRHDES